MAKPFLHAVLLLVVTAAAVLPAQDLSLTSAGYEGAVVGQPFSYTIAIAPANGATLSATGLPSTLTCNGATGVISGTPTAVGAYEVTIAASDASGTAAKVLRIDVNAESPVVIADPGTLVADAGTAFSYQLAASGSPTSFTATGLPPGLTINAATGFISGTATTGGSYPLSLVAMSAQGSWVTSLNLNVYPYLPVVAARTITTTVGDAVRLDIAGSEVPTSYGASGLPTGLHVDGATGIITGIPTSAGTSSCTVSASNAGGTGTATWTIVVNPQGVGTVTATNPFPGATVGSAFTAQINATGTPTGYAAQGLPANLTVNAATGAITGTPAADLAGSYPILYSATYAGGTVANSTTLIIGPALPVITAPTTIMAELNEPFLACFPATNSPIGFSASGLPSGLGIDPVLGVINGTPTQSGTFAVTVMASAAGAGGAGTATISLVVLSVPASVAAPGAPLIANAQTLAALVGVPFSGGILATNAPTSYSASGLPANLSIDPSSGIISGTATAAGTSVATILCSNGSGTATATVTIFVYPVPLPAIDSSLADQYALLGAPFSDQLVATYGPATFAATGLPPGLTIASATGLISGTPTSLGTYVGAITVSNASGSTTDLMTIIVTALPALPDFNYANTLVATVGTLCTFTPKNGAGTTYVATGLPGTLSINATTGVISGTPTVVATYAVTVSGSNSSGTTTVDTTIIVNPSGGPGISSALTTITLAVNTPLSYTVTSATAGATFAAANLPPGAMIDAATGAISGSPTAGGTFVVILSSSSGGLTTEEPLTIVVTPAPPVITTQILGTGRVGDAYYSTIGASNAPTAYTATGLPPGLVVDPVFGTISGVPTTAGVSAVVVSASNAGGSGSATLALTINPPSAPTITSPTTIYVLPNDPFTYQITTLNGATLFAATGLPAGVGITTGTGLISGVTTVLGTVQVVITASNAVDSRSEVLDIVTVTPGSPGAPSPPAQPSSGGCGLGSVFSMVLMLMLAAWYRRGLGNR